MSISCDEVRNKNFGDCAHKRYYYQGYPKDKNDGVKEEIRLRNL